MSIRKMSLHSYLNEWEISHSNRPFLVFYRPILSFCIPFTPVLLNLLQQKFSLKYIQVTGDRGYSTNLSSSPYGLHSVHFQVCMDLPFRAHSLDRSWSDCIVFCIMSRSVQYLLQRIRKDARIIWCVLSNSALFVEQLWHFYPPSGWHIFD